MAASGESTVLVRGLSRLCMHADERLGLPEVEQGMGHALDVRHAWVAMVVKA